MTEQPSKSLLMTHLGHGGSRNCQVWVDESLHEAQNKFLLDLQVVDSRTVAVRAA